MKKNKFIIAGITALFVSASVHAQTAEQVELEAGTSDRVVLDNSMLLNSNVDVATNLGNFGLQLRGDVAPKTVNNFLDYVSAEAYSNSFFHRSVAGFVVQGGGFFAVDGEEGLEVHEVEQNDPVENEFNLSNVRGTVAMAKMGDDPDSATNQWFVNVLDNSENLDEQNGGFTVFAEVMGDGMNVVDAINDVQQWDLGGVFDSIPLVNFDEETPAVEFEHLVIIESIAPIIEIVSNSNPALVEAAIKGSALVLTAPGESSGTAEIVLGISEGEGSRQETFEVAVVIVPPEITSQPASATVTEDHAATFEVSASGTAPSFRWERSFDNGDSWEVISGATDSTYSTGPTTLSMDGEHYRAVVSNEAGTETSNEATLTVNPGPAFFAEEFEMLAIGVELVNYQFLSSQRFQSDGREGEWTYEKTDFETGKLVFSYDDGAEEELDLTFPNPNQITIGEETVDLDFDFFGLEPASTRQRSSFWFGGFNQRHFDDETGEGWVLHDEHEWLYAAGNGYAEGMWLWDHIQQDWLWTRAGIYPFLYSDNRGAWLFYEREGSPEERWFYSYEEDAGGEPVGWIEVSPSEEES